jgi:hypothetical protein
LADPSAVSPDLRRPILLVVGRYADEAAWDRIHQLGLASTNMAEKQNDYDALTCATNPALVKKTLQIALTSELPTSRATFLVGKVALSSDHPDMAWPFARENMKALRAKLDSLGAAAYAPGLFSFFSDLKYVDELKNYARASQPALSAREVAKAVDEIQVRAELKERLGRQFTAWSESRKMN